MKKHLLFMFIILLPLLLNSCEGEGYETSGSEKEIRKTKYGPAIYYIVGDEIRESRYGAAVYYIY